jgi:queuine tRNA-ribosyltransferase
MEGKFSFEVIERDGEARRGLIRTRHGDIETPAFMPVGTYGTVKALVRDDLESVGTQVVLVNAYHLYLRPGAETVESLGGIHMFMNWERPVLSDSGGFQVYSLARLCRVWEEGVEFQSHLDGSRHFFSPEKVVEIQNAIGSDIIMPLDECLALPAERQKLALAVERTVAWARRSRLVHKRDDRALFGILQGGLDMELRKKCLEQLLEIGFEGYALGGLSVGESASERNRVVSELGTILPHDKPRYLMGVGMPDDIVAAVKEGVDMFDCVIPTRNARNGQLFTSSGKIAIKNSQYAQDAGPVDEDCRCPVCRRYSRAYLRHLYVTGDILSSRLNTIHNLFFFNELMRRMREAIAGGIFSEFEKSFLQQWQIEENEKDSEGGKENRLK